MRIEIPVFDGFDELDAIAPYEVLRTAGELSADAGWEVTLVGAHGPGEVVAAHGLRLSVSDGLGRPDAVIVPGGDLLTAAGVTAGLDLSLWIVEREHGSAVADAVATEIEHQRVRQVHRSLR